LLAVVGAFAFLYSPACQHQAVAKEKEKDGERERERERERESLNYSR
jgi:hypothetical protein